MRSVISSLLVAACAALLTGCAGGSSPTSATAPSTPAAQAARSLTPPEAPAGAAVLASLTGQGGSRGAHDVTTDGSYAAYLVCSGGQEVVVVSAASKTDTPVPCTGYVSRLRYLTDGHAESLTVRAGSGQTWALTVADATLGS